MQLQAQVADALQELERLRDAREATASSPENKTQPNQVNVFA
jgi:hypothetical protein